MYLKSHLHFEFIHHELGRGVSIAVLVHHLIHDLAINEHLVHTALETFEIPGHDLNIRLLRVVHQVGDLVEGTHHHLVGIVALDLGHQVVHLH